MSTCGICHDEDDVSFPVCRDARCSVNKMCWSCLNGHCESQRRFRQIPSCPWCRGPLIPDLAVNAQAGAGVMDVEDDIVEGAYNPDDYEDVYPYGQGVPNEHGVPFDPIMADAMFGVYPYGYGVPDGQGQGVQVAPIAPQVPPPLAAHYLAYNNQDDFPVSPLIAMGPISPGYNPTSPNYSPDSPVYDPTSGDLDVEANVFPQGHRLNPIDLSFADNRGTRTDPIELY